MLQVLNLTKSFGGRTLFSEANFSIGDGERVGLVGRNGHGKTTLFKILIGEEGYDSGEIVLSKNSTIGHLSQTLNFTHRTVLEEGCSALPIEQRDQVYRVEKVLTGLGITPEMMNLAPAQLSGGYQVRLNLAKVLVSDAQCLLLDEPTNYLDIVSLRWLGQYLRNWPHELFMITHDRSFMDSVVDHVVGIHRGRVRKIKGRTVDYFEKIAQEEEIYEKTRQNEEKKIKEMENYINSFRAQARHASLVQSRVKALARVEQKDKLSHIAQLDFAFREQPFSGKWPLVVKDLAFGYEEGSLLFTGLNFALHAGDCLAIIGKNGKGKTTLLNLLAGKMAPSAGTIELHNNARMSYFEQTNKNLLDPMKSVEEEIALVAPDLPYSTVRAICGAMMFEGENAKKRISILSGGEKSRVMLGKVLAMPTNLLMLDEPTNHLDMESCEALCESLKAFTGTIALVTHDESLLRFLPNKFVIFQRGGATFFEGSYEDFLEKVGWEEERDGGVGADGVRVTEKESKKLTLKEQRQERQRLILERSRELTPLRKRWNDLESEIFELEERKGLIDQEVCQAAGQQQGTKVAQLSQELAKISTRLETLYNEYEQTAMLCEEREAHYAELLKALEQ